MRVRLFYIVPGKISGKKDTWQSRKQVQGAEHKQGARREHRGVRPAQETAPAEHVLPENALLPRRRVQREEARVLPLLRELLPEGQLLREGVSSMKAVRGCRNRRSSAEIYG